MSGRPSSTPASPPRAAWILGVAGLLPFVALSTLAHLRPEPWYAIWLAALAQYGAVILAFVGALHWGYAVQRDLRGSASGITYGWSVMPALLGWMSLQLPIWSALRMQAATLVLCVAVDRVLARHYAVPDWFMPLRYTLTLVAASCLGWASIA